MKILMLLTRLEGGVGRYCQEVKKELEKRGHEVKIISREDNMRITSMKKSFIPIRRLLCIEMMKNNYDIILSNDWSIALPLLVPRKIYADRHFCVFHGTEPISKKMQKFVGNKMGDHLIVVGDQLKGMFPKATMIYEGVDLKQFYKIPSIKKVDNSIGFANFRNDIYHYDEIKEAVRACKKKLFIAEFIPHEKMCQFYNQFEIGITLPPSFTGFGLTVLEMMACGVPKIITNNAGVGCRLPCDKIEDYASIECAIKECKKRDYRSWLVKHKDEFSWEGHVNKLIEVFDNDCME